MLHVIRQFHSTALYYFNHHGDDRLLTFAAFYLPLCLLQADPRDHTDADRPTVSKSAARRQCHQRCDAYATHGPAILPLLLLDYRAAAYHTARRRHNTPAITSNDTDAGPDPIQQLRSATYSLLSDPRNMREALDSTTAAPTTDAHVNEFATQAGLQHAATTDTNPLPPQRTFDPADYDSNAIRHRLPATNTTPIHLPSPETPSGPPQRVNGKSHSDMANAMQQFLRATDPSKAGYVDGTDNATLKLYLTDPNGWKLPLDTITAIESHRMLNLAHRDRNDPLAANLSTTLFLSHLRRTRGATFPKPKKPDKLRAIELSTAPLALYSGFLSTLYKKEITKSNGTAQLGQTSRGMESITHAHQYLAQHLPRQYVRVSCDVVNFYPSADHATLVDTVSRRLPQLARAALIATGPTYLSLATADNRTSTLQKHRGVSQGTRYATALTNTLTAQLIDDTREYATTLPTKTSINHTDPNTYAPAPDDINRTTITAYADNINYSCPVEYLPLIDNYIRTRAAQLGQLEISDYTVHLHGTPTERDATETRLRQYLPPHLQAAIKRPDRTQAPNDVAEVYGVPIAAPHETPAIRAWLQRRCSTIITYATDAITLRDNALAVTYTSPHYDRIAKQSPTHHLTQLLIPLRRSLDHISRSLPRTYWWAPFSEHEQTYHQLLRTGLRIPDDVPDSRICGALERNPANAGAGARPVTAVGDAAYLSSLTHTYPTICQLLDVSPQSPPPYLADQLQTTGHRLTTRHDSLRDRHQQTSADPDRPTPPPSTYNPEDITTMINEALAPLLRDTNPSTPNTITQAPITKTFDYYHMQHEYCHAELYTTGLPSHLTTADQLHYVRHINLRNRARGGSTLWMLKPSTRDVLTGARVRYAFTEAEYCTALRQQLGIGLNQLGTRPTDVSFHCSCHHAGPNHVSIDQHAMTGGCAWSRGQATARHNTVLTSLINHHRAANVTTTKEHNVTTATPAHNVTNPAQKYMDIVATDPTTGTAHWIDVTITNTLTATGLRRSRQDNFRTRDQTKRNTYAAEASHHRAHLIPFILDANGSFQPNHDSTPPTTLQHNVAPVPTATDSADTAPHVHVPTNRVVFARPKAPARGTLALSTEEGILRNLALRTTDPAGPGVYDRTLLPKAAASMLFLQFRHQISYAAIRGSARIALTAARSGYLKSVAHRTRL